MATSEIIFGELGGGGGGINPTVSACEYGAYATKTYTVDLTKSYIAIITTGAKSAISSLVGGILTSLYNDDTSASTISLSGTTLTLAHVAYANTNFIVIQLD